MYWSAWTILRNMTKFVRYQTEGDQKDANDQNAKSGPEWIVRQSIGKDGCGE